MKNKISPQELERYRAKIREKVCGRCIDCGEDRKCTLTGERDCGVEIHLEKIIHVVRRVKSTSLSDYITALRSEVCDHCDNQKPDGSCLLRRSVDCALDRYLELVVEAIEEVDRS